MQLFVVLSTVDYETYNEFHGVFSSYENAIRKIESMPEYFRGLAWVYEVSLDDMNWDSAT